MRVARVVGNVWATKKHPGLDRMKLLLVSPIDGASGETQGDTALAVDKKFGAGPGDTVLLMDEGGSARQILEDGTAPVRLIICGIVDSLTLNGKSFQYH